MKKVIVIFLLVFLSSSISITEISAQDEKKGSVIGTFGIGGGFGTTVETAPQFSFIFDLNLISKTGFTLSLSDFINVRPGALGPSQNLMFGFGYNFLKDNWNIGGTIIAAPTSQDVLVGGKINGGYFFTDDIGVTGIITYRQTVGIVSDLSMFDAFAGISIRF